VPALASSSHADQKFLIEPDRAFFAPLTEWQISRGMHHSVDCKALNTFLDRHDADQSPQMG
jgi:hypothetical protein